MDLLPKSSEEFTSQKYWDAFFTKRKQEAFEWYGEYCSLATHLHKYISHKDKLLIVGCGNSSLGWDLHNAGIKNQINLDISEVVVKQMKAKYPGVEFLEGDVTNLTFPEKTFSCILDKGTFDALSPPPNSTTSRNQSTQEEKSETDEKVVKVERMMTEIEKVLKPGGRFICISLLQPHVASRLLSRFHELGWMMRIVRCLEAEETTAEKSDEKAVIFPVFMAIFTKLALPPGIIPVIEASSPSNSSTITRFTSLDDLLNFIKDQQNFALIKKGLRQLGFCSEKTIQLKLSNAINGEDRFILNIVDVPKLLNNPVTQKFGIFIVPQGRETEWLFGTHEGRISLALQANVTRLVVVHLVRGQVYANMDAIQEEIKGPLASTSPLCVTEKNIKAPIMTLGNDVGDRDIVYKGHSKFSGDIIIEDVKYDGKVFRRLIFLNNPNVIQSEVEMSVVKKRGKKFCCPILSKLSCQHHGLMTLSIGFLNYFLTQELEPSPINLLIIGLGGGGLASFLLNFIPNLALTVVEIDPEIVKVAKCHFGLPYQNEKLTIIVNDGLKFLQSTDSQYNIIFVDVDNKSTKEGLSCPPPEFLDAISLKYFKERMKPRSILVINLVCRNTVLKNNYISSLQKHFPLLLMYDVVGEVNTLIFCFTEFSSEKFSLKNIAAHVRSSVDLTISSIVLRKTKKSGKDADKKPQGKFDESKLNCFYGAFDDVELLANNFQVLQLSH